MAKYQIGTAEHERFLREDADRQIEFFRSSLRSDGGFDVLDYAGKPIPDQPQELHTTTRLVHSYALAKAYGAKECDPIIDAGMSALWNWHRDTENGGYFWSVRGETPVNPVKLAYGHVFVLLAGASALQAGHGEAQRLIEDVADSLERHYWDEARGLFCDEFNADWTPFSTYRGMNANMHGAEAMLAAYKATGEAVYLNRAGRILEFFTQFIAPQFEWRIPEHYTENWEIDADYEGDPMFRPKGTTPGHSFEFGRLLIELWELTGRENDRLVHTARNLVEQALSDAWDTEKGGFVYTLTLQGHVDKPNRYWWPVTEAIGVLARLHQIDPHEQSQEWYRKIWEFADLHLIDHEKGGWFPELDDQNHPTAKQFQGKPDLYHALQADLIALECSKPS